ncbi:MAG: hypothetical protein AAFY15_13035, partial [Cyanobacteria bacterium J06648_11]
MDILSFGVSYAVLPLSHQAGVVGWVQHCDTLHSLIKEYRETRSIIIDVEHRLMTQFAPEYDKLTPLQQCEVFTTALENTTGLDLYKVSSFVLGNFSRSFSYAIIHPPFHAS